MSVKSFSTDGKAFLGFVSSLHLPVQWDRALKKNKPPTCCNQNDPSRLNKTQPGNDYQHLFDARGACADLEGGRGDRSGPPPPWNLQS